jgi:hypothetical protein
VRIAVSVSVDDELEAATRTTAAGADIDVLARLYRQRVAADAVIVDKRGELAARIAERCHRSLPR